MTDTSCSQLFAACASHTKRLCSPSVPTGKADGPARPRAGSCARLALLILVAALSCTAQTQQQGSANGPDGPALQDLQSQVRELKQLVLQLQKQTVDSHTEITRLREELENRQTDGGAGVEAAGIDQQSPAYGVTTAQLDQRLQHVEEDQELLSGKIDDQYQTKLESASRYRIRFSGIVLFNLFGNSGSVDSEDVPTWATHAHSMDSSGSVGATMRQSILGFEAFGPEFFGARTSANVNFDFGGGFPATDNGVSSGIVRLRTAAVRLDWKNNSIIAGQDQLFLSPIAPTSFASVIVPPLSYAGNLWAWTPQLRFEHRVALSGEGSLSLQGAFLDPMTGEPPDADYYTWYRSPSAGEASRQPGYAGRVGYTRPIQGQTFTAGVGGYYSRQNWGFDRMINGWTTIADMNLPLGHKFSVSGEFYRGAAIGGFGAALGRSVLFDGPLSDPNTVVVPLNVVGGWGQIKFRATPKLEFNGAYGQDSPFAADVRMFGDASDSYAPFYLTGNRAAFGNVTYRPRSDLLMSLEYRRMRSFTIYDSSYEANQINMSMGVLF